MAAARDRVAAGALWLDEHGPVDWRDDIDVDTLDVSDPWLCPLGQLFGSYSQAVNVTELASADLESFGFAAGYGTSGDCSADSRPTWVGYPELTDAWRELLTT